MHKSIDSVRLNPLQTRRDALRALGAGAVMAGVGIAPGSARAQDDEPGEDTMPPGHPQVGDDSPHAGGGGTGGGAIAALPPSRAMIAFLTLSIKDWVSKGLSMKSSTPA